MFSEGDRLCIGMKQSRKAIDASLADRVYIAHDADPEIRDEIKSLCMKKEIPFNFQYTMQELGEAGGIKVSAAVVTVLK